MELTKWNLLWRGSNCIKKNYHRTSCSLLPCTIPARAIEKTQKNISVGVRACVRVCVRVCVRAFHRHLNSMFYASHPRLCQQSFKKVQQANTCMRDLDKPALISFQAVTMEICRKQSRQASFDQKRSCEEIAKCSWSQNRVRNRPKSAWSITWCTLVVGFF